MKKSNENQGYEIVKEFEELKERVDQKPWILLLLFLGCGALWYIHIKTIEEVSQKGILELALIGIGMAAEIFGVVTALWYMVRRKNGELSFRISLFLVFVSGRVCAICFPIIYHDVNAYEGAEKIITMLCSIAALLFSIVDTIRFYQRYQSGCYKKGEKQYSFSFGKQEKIATALIVISLFPIMFRGVRLTLHNTSIPKEVLNLYGAYLMSLIFCMLNRFHVKVFSSIVLYRRMKLRKGIRS